MALDLYRVLRVVVVVVVVVERAGLAVLRETDEDERAGLYEREVEVLRAGVYEREVEEPLGDTYERRVLLLYCGLTYVELLRLRL